MCVCVCVCMCVCVCVCICVCVSVCVCVCVCDRNNTADCCSSSSKTVSRLNTHAVTLVCTLINNFAYPQGHQHGHGQDSGPSGHHTYACAHTQKHACTHRRMHAHTHTCAHTHIHAHTHSCTFSHKLYEGGGSSLNTHKHTHTHTSEALQPNTGPLINQRNSGSQTLLHNEWRKVISASGNVCVIEVSVCFSSSLRQSACLSVCPPASPHVSQSLFLFCLSLPLFFVYFSSFHSSSVSEM